MRKIKETFREKIDSKPTIKCTVFKDNNICIQLANSPKMKSRTKHNGIKYHHFRSKVKDGSMDILKISTKDQQRDIFTKVLSRGQFLKLRKLICRW